jgi:hypothetical protein
MKVPIEDLKKAVREAKGDEKRSLWLLLVSRVRSGS